MAVFIVLWPYLLTTKLKSVIRHNLGHSNIHINYHKSLENIESKLVIICTLAYGLTLILYE